MRLSSCFLSLLLAVPLTACDDDDGDLSPQTCELECERVAQCSPSADMRPCRDRCASPFDEPPPLAPRYLDAVRRCLAAVSCDAVSLDSAGEKCTYDAALDLKPSKPAEDLCRRAYRADALCGATTFASSTCLDDVKIYDDEALRRAARCYDQACRDQPSCLEQVFGYPYPYLDRRPR